jgi:hypothetical protein
LNLRAGTPRSLVGAVRIDLSRRLTSPGRRRLQRWVPTKTI